MAWNVPVEAAAELCGVTHQTAFEWRHRVFATVRGRRDGIVLGGRVWIDEVYVKRHRALEGVRPGPQARPVQGEAVHSYRHRHRRVQGPGGVRLRARQAVDQEDKGGTAEPPGGGHTVVCARQGARPQRGHRRQGVRLGGLQGRRGRPGLPRGQNNLSSWLKRYLWRFTGMDPANLQSYLDWFVYLFRVRQAQDRWPKTARVVRHLIMADATYRT